MAIQLFNQLGWASTNLGALSEIQQLLIQAAGESGTYIDDIVKVTSNVGDDAIRTISGAAGGGAAGGALGIPLLAWLNGLGLVYGYNQLSSAGAEQEADQYFQDAEIITNTTPSNWTVDDMRAVGWHDAAGGGRF